MITSLAMTRTLSLARSGLSTLCQGDVIGGVSHRAGQSDFVTDKLNDRNRGILGDCRNGGFFQRICKTQNNRMISLKQPHCLQGAVANRLRRRTSDQTILGSNPAVAAALSPWTRLFTPISQGEAFTLASISYLAILVKYILAKKKTYNNSNASSLRQNVLCHIFFKDTLCRKSYPYAGMMSASETTCP